MDNNLPTIRIATFIASGLAKRIGKLVDYHNLESRENDIH